MIQVFPPGVIPITMINARYKFITKIVTGIRQIYVSHAILELNDGTTARIYYSVASLFGIPDPYKTVPGEACVTSIRRFVEAMISRRVIPRNGIVEEVTSRSISVPIIDAKVLDELAAILALGHPIDRDGRRILQFLDDTPVSFTGALGEKFKQVMGLRSTYSDRRVTGLCFGSIMT